MADIKISSAVDPGALVSTDKVPLARLTSTTSYAATIAEIASFANGAYLPNYATGTPAMDGTGAPGTASTVSRGDHTHPTDTSRYAASNPAGYVTAAQAASAAPVQSVAGRAGTVTLTHADITDWTASVPQASSTMPLIEGTAAVGVGTTFARADHVHPAAPASGVTSITAGGGLSGGTITTTGTIALVAPVTVANGGTGATTASTALTNLGAAPIVSPVFTGDARAVTASVGDNDTSIATTAFVQTATASVPYAGNVGRNLLHNGLFNVQQRGAGPWTANGAYTADRWQQAFNLDTVQSVITAANDTDRSQIGDEAVRSYYTVTVTGNAGAAAYTQVIQTIEGIRRLSGKTVLLSFYAKASAAGMKLGFNGTQIFGSGGSPSSTIEWLVTGLSVTLGTTWARYSVALTVPSTAGKTVGTDGNDSNQIQIAFSSGATTNAAFGNIGVQSGAIALWGIQLEVAQPGQTQPTPLEKLDPADDLRHCQRFYQAFTISDGGYGAAGPLNPAGPARLFPTTMRATPTMVAGSPG